MGFMRLTRETFTLPRTIEPDVEIVAVGDIHGRADLFGELLDAAATTRIQTKQRRLVLLGDLIDRGPDSLGALALARGAGERIGAGETIGLFGNHEILMRMALDPEIPERAGLRALQVWLSNGGDAV